jgi:predicted O-methyltransferase YrrM
MRQLNDATWRYITNTFAPEDAELKAIRLVGEDLVPGMQVSAAEGKLLQLLLRMIGAKRVLEIGSFVGYSTVCMARALPENGELISLEYNPDHAMHTRAHCAAYPVEVMEGDAKELLRVLEGPFDAVFIDAEKRRYVDYLDAVLPLLRPGGLIMADNSLLFGAMAGEPLRDNISHEAEMAMRLFNQRLAAECDGMLIPTPEGLTVGVKK